MKNKLKLKNVAFMILFVVIVAFIFVNGSDIQEMITHKKADKQEQELLDQKIENSYLSEQVDSLNSEVSDLEDDLSEQEDPNSNSQDQEEKNEKLLKDFVENWINFDSIGDRNKSVKNFLSEEAVEEHNIDSEVFVEFKSKGSVNKVAKMNVQDQQSYMILADVDSKEEKSKMLIEAVVEGNQISKFDSSYVENIEE